MGRVYEQILGNAGIYRERLIKIPTPELWVLYNGERNFPLEKVLCLSDAFQEQNDYKFVELRTKVININTDSHSPVLQKSSSLREYSLLISKIRFYLKKNMSRDNAIKLSIQECIKEGILVDFLLRCGSVVENNCIWVEELMSLVAQRKPFDQVQEHVILDVFSRLSDYYCSVANIEESDVLLRLALLGEDTYVKKQLVYLSKAINDRN